MPCRHLPQCPRAFGKVARQRSDIREPSEFSPITLSTSVIEFRFDASRLFEQERRAFQLTVG